MDCVPVNQLTIVPFYAGAVLFYGYRFVRGQGGISTPVTIRLMVGAMLILAAALSESLTAPPVWQHLSSLLLFHQGMLFTFLGVDYLLNNQRQQPILRHKVLLPITILSLLSVMIDGLRLHVFGRIAASYQPLETIDYLAYLSNYGVQIIILALMIMYYGINLSKHKDIVYIFRRALCMIGFTISMVCILTTRLKFLFFMDSAQQPWSSGTCQINLLISSIFLTIGFMVPHAILKKVVAPISWLVHSRQNKIDRLIDNLHATMLIIVPSIQLNNRSIRHMRAFIEINDARQTIWSHVIQEHPITPKEDAQIIIELLNQGIVIIEPGDYTPPPLHYQCPIRHNIATARYLNQLLMQQVTSTADLSKKSINGLTKN